MGKRAAPGAFVHTLRGLTFPWPFLGGCGVSLSRGFVLQVSKTAAHWVHPPCRGARISPWGSLALRASEGAGVFRFIFEMTLFTGGGCCSPS